MITSNSWITRLNSGPGPDLPKVKVRPRCRTHNAQPAIKRDFRENMPTTPVGSQGWGKVSAFPVKHMPMQRLDARKQQLAKTTYSVPILKGSPMSNTAGKNRIEPRLSRQQR